MKKILHPLGWILLPFLFSPSGHQQPCSRMVPLTRPRTSSNTIFNHSFPPGKRFTQFPWHLPESCKRWERSKEVSSTTNHEESRGRLGQAKVTWLNDWSELKINHINICHQKQVHFDRLIHITSRSVHLNTAAYWRVATYLCQDAKCPNECCTGSEKVLYRRWEWAGCDCLRDGKEEKTSDMKIGGRFKRGNYSVNHRADLILHATVKYFTLGKARILIPTPHKQGSWLKPFGASAVPGLGTQLILLSPWQGRTAHPLDIMTQEHLHHLINTVTSAPNFPYTVTNDFG